MSSTQDKQREIDVRYYEDLQHHLNLLNDLEAATTQLRSEVDPLLEELRRSQAPFLTHHKPARRMLCRLLNMLIFPWGHRQMRFNYGLLAVMEKCHERLVELERTRLILHRLEARLADRDASS